MIVLDEGTFSINLCFQIFFTLTMRLNLLKITASFFGNKYLLCIERDKDVSCQRIECWFVCQAQNALDVSKWRQQQQQLMQHRWAT